MEEHRYWAKTKYQHKCLKCKELFSNNKPQSIFCGGEKCINKQYEEEMIANEKVN